ncbi:unnamed protein product [Caenorhabditis auriculariae]|uniref:Uncharacterized protein n=1 Tax=Caenorhabditis auriculariae TaxID=2777116 RepID=A0A8S1GR15_9PELO|nr:unnamed protein product [Caenorhabditis auriculariae]
MSSLLGLKFGPKIRFDDFSSTTKNCTKIEIPPHEYPATPRDIRSIESSNSVTSLGKHWKKVDTATSSASATASGSSLTINGEEPIKTVKTSESTSSSTTMTSSTKPHDLRADFEHTLGMQHKQMGKLRQTLATCTTSLQNSTRTVLETQARATTKHFEDLEDIVGRRDAHFLMEKRESEAQREHLGKVIENTIDVFKLRDDVNEMWEEEREMIAENGLLKLMMEDNNVKSKRLIDLTLSFKNADVVQRGALYEEFKSRGLAWTAAQTTKMASMLHRLRDSVIPIRNHVTYEGDRQIIEDVVQRSYEVESFLINLHAYLGELNQSIAETSAPASGSTRSLTSAFENSESFVTTLPAASYASLASLKTARPDDKLFSAASSWKSASENWTMTSSTNRTKVMSESDRSLSEYAAPTEKSASHLISASSRDPSVFIEKHFTPQPTQLSSSTLSLPPDPLPHQQNDAKQILINSFLKDVSENPPKTLGARPTDIESNEPERDVYTAKDISDYEKALELSNTTRASVKGFSQRSDNARGPYDVNELLKYWKPVYDAIKRKKKDDSVTKRRSRSLAAKRSRSKTRSRSRTRTSSVSTGRSDFSKPTTALTAISGNSLDWAIKKPASLMTCLSNFADTSLSSKTCLSNFADTSLSSKTCRSNFPKTSSSSSSSSISYSSRDSWPNASLSETRARTAHSIGSAVSPKPPRSGSEASLGPTSNPTSTASSESSPILRTARSIESLTGVSQNRLYNSLKLNANLCGVPISNLLKSDDECSTQTSHSR